MGRVAGLIAFLLVATGSAAAQTAAPVEGPAFETDAFSAAEVVAGKRMAEPQCAVLAGAVWVTVDGRGECIRYYHSNAGGGGREAVVLLSTDVVSTNGRREVAPLPWYLKDTPDSVQRVSVNWSKHLKMPYVVLARPGTYGSSGHHGERRSEREIALVSAALDAIKARHGYTRLHFAGFDTGGHTAAALLPRRTDVGCVVLASSLLSVRSRLLELGRNDDFTGNKNPVDPVVLVDRVEKRPELRIVVITDPDDVMISARSQTEYVKRASAAGLPVQQIFAAASDVSAHDFRRMVRDVTADCARGMSNDKIVAKYQNKLTEPEADDPPLHARDHLSRSVVLTKAQCEKLPTAAWVHVEGQNFCVRYWLSTAGGKKDEVVVYIPGDIGGKKPGELNPYSASVTAGQLQRGAHYWSRTFGGPYVSIGRLGTFGSSGTHRDRRKLLEIKVMATALDALKARHGFKRLHLAGQSGGGHTVAGLVQMRSDIGCAVMAAGVLSYKTSLRDSGREVRPGLAALYDPIEFVATMQHQPGRRLIVMSDPDDRIVSYRGQREFFERVKAKGLPILLITADSGQENFHGLSEQATRAAIDCAKDVDDAALIAKYQTKATPVPPTATRR